MADYAYIDFESEALKFAKERGLDRVAPCVVAAMQRGAELQAEMAARLVHSMRDDLASAHHTTIPAHGEKSGTLTPIAEDGK